jgi:hypothetical protein
MKFERLIKLIRKCKVSPFIGAGFSIEAKAPTVEELSSTILTGFDNDKLRNLHKDDSLQDLTNFFVEEVCNGSRNQLIELLREKFYFTPACMDDHLMLAKIPHFKHIFTTNYDTLLEDSYPQAERNVVRNDKDCTYIQDKNTTVFKIHGDFTDPDSVVITSNDYKQFFEKPVNSELWDLTKTEFLTKHILFIGYNLRDDNVINIIKHISDAVGKNKKDMFLIVPSINESRKKQLKKLGVTYYEAYASEFLNELITELKANISKDFRHGDISADIYTKFCNFHDFTPGVIMPPDGENQINDFKPLKNKAIEQQIKFTVDDAYKDIINNMDFEKYGVIIDNPIYPAIPKIEFKGEHLLNCIHSVNGVVIDDEISAILVMPIPKDCELTIRIPSRNFIEKIKGKAYALNKQKVVFDMDFHIYTMKLVVTINMDAPIDRKYNVDFTFKSKDTYTDNNLAIKWVDFISAFFSGEDVYIKEISNIPFNSDNTVKNVEHNFEKYKEYYTNIKQIELLTGEKFSLYHDCSEQAYYASCKLVAYLKHEPVIIKSPGGVKISAEATMFSDYIESDCEKEEMAAVSTSADIVLELNDKTYKIPYMHSIFSPCKVMKMERKDKDIIDIEFKYEADQYYALYSDKSTLEEFPKVESLD